MENYFPTIPMPTAAGQKAIGKVVHYFDKIGVAIVELSKALKVGDTVTFKRGEQEFEQVVDSMQIDHVGVEKAKKGQVIGMKVSEPVKEGTEMLR